MKGKFWQGLPWLRVTFLFTVKMVWQCNTEASVFSANDLYENFVSQWFLRLLVQTQLWGSLVEKIDATDFPRFMFLKQTKKRPIAYNHFLNKTPPIVREERADSKVKSGWAHFSCALCFATFKISLHRKLQTPPPPPLFSKLKSKVDPYPLYAVYC